MRLSKRLVLFAGWLLASALAWGQNRQVNGRQSIPIRMSFRSESWGLTGSGSFQQTCFSVDGRTGHYEMQRVTMTVTVSPAPTQGSPIAGSSSGPPHTEQVQGIMFASELQSLQKLLAGSEFLKLAAQEPKGTVLHKGADDFVAEVPRENGVQRVVARDEGGESPFPRSVQEIVSWLQHFKAENTEPFDVSEDICPDMFVEMRGHTFIDLH